MNMNHPLPLTAVVLLLSLASASSVPAANKACSGISKKCTTDTTYDKTIGTTVYSCYDCKQALCKDDGNGGISGTSTSSVCTEKATTFQPMPAGGQLDGPDRMAPKPGPGRRPGNEQRLPGNEVHQAAPPGLSSTRQRKPATSASEINAAQGDSGADKRASAATGSLRFDEADALFGRRTKGQSAKPAKPPAATEPRAEPGPIPPGTPVPYPVHSD